VGRLRGSPPREQERRGATLSLHAADSFVFVSTEVLVGVDDHPATPATVTSRFSSVFGKVPTVSTPRRISLFGVWLVSTLFYYWTATTSGDPIVFGQPQTDYYNLLADGFLKGHLSVLSLPPKGLLALSNPYNPYANSNFSGNFHDLALYHGHFYLTWGPTPVLTLYLPWRLLHLGQIDQNLACLIFASVGLWFALLLLDALVTRFVPRVGAWKLAISGLLLASASVLPYLLRTPEIYQVSIAGAYCFAMVSLYLLASALAGGRVRRWRLAAGSLAAGLSAGSHWDLVLLGAVLVALVVWLHRHAEDRSRQGLVRLGALVLAPFAVVVIALLVYNVARFGSPLQFGASYQLAGYDPTKTPFYRLGYLWPSLYYYFVAPVRWTFAFPFFALSPPPAYPGGVPSTYVPEVIGGILTTTPLLLLLFALPFLRRRFTGEFLRICLLLCGLGLVLAVLIAFSLPGGSMRYEADYATFLILPAVLAWMLWTPAARWGRRLLAGGGALLALYGATVAVAVSTTGATDQFRLGDPTAYAALQRTTSVLPTLLVRLEGHPSVIRVIDPDAGYPTALGDYGTYHPGTSFTLLSHHEEIDILAPDTASYVMRAQFGRAATAPTGGRITVYVQDGAKTLHFRYRPGERHVQLVLQRGLNQIFAWVTFTHPQAPGAFPDILTVAQLQIQRLP
jgi:hypothetical protein